MSGLQALLFDVDGTLADTERDGHRVAFNQAFKKAGLDWDWSVELYGELLAITGGKERMRYFQQQHRPEVSIGDDAIADLHAVKTGFYTEMLRNGAIPLRPGVERLLHETRSRGLRLAIATTTTMENVEALIHNTLGHGAISWFEVIGAGDVVPHKKPAPDIYFYTMEQLGLEANQCLAFEDSENGIHATRGAGLTTVITVNDYTREQRFNDAALVLDQFGEPDSPFQALQGDPGKHTFFDLDLAQEIHHREHQT